MDCCICYDVITPPAAVTNCGHHFCKSCILDWKKISTYCPICRRSITEILDDEELDKQLCETTVSCSYRGCDAEVSVVELSAHMESCQHSPAEVKLRRQERQRLLEKRMDEFNGNFFEIIDITTGLFKEQCYEKALPWISKLLSKYQEKHIVHFLITLEFRIKNELGEYQFVYNACKQPFVMENEYEFTRIEYAIACIGCGKYDEAQTVLDHTDIDKCKENAYYVQGLIHKKKCQYALAEAALQRCIELTKDEGLYLNARVALGDVYRKVEKFKEAREHYEYVLHKLEEGAAQETDIYYSLGYIHEKECSYSEALRRYGQALKRLPEQHPKAGIYHIKIGDVHRLLSHFPKALSDYEKGIKLIEERLGEGHVETADGFMGIGLVNKKEAKYEAALHYFCKALSILRSNLSESHYKIGHCLKDIGDLYRKRNMDSEALSCYSSALDIFKSSKMDMELADTCHDMGRAYYDSSEYELAHIQFQFAISRIKKLFSSHEKLGSYLSSDALYYVSKGEYETAEELFQDALKNFAENLGNNHPEVADCYMNMIEMYMKQLQEGCDLNREKALSYCTKAKEIFLKVHSEDHPKLHTLNQYCYIIDSV